MLGALWFVLAGMGIVFLTLSVLVLAMSGLNRWLGPARDTGRRGAGSAGQGNA